MALTITCPACGRQLALDEQHRGWQVRCPSCQTEFAAEGDPARPPVPPAGGPPGAWPPPPAGGFDFGGQGREDWTWEARQRLSGPATWLKVVGWIGLVFGGLYVVGFPLLAVFVMAQPNNGGKDEAELIGNIVGGCVQGVLLLALGGLILYGAGKMQRLESHGWAMTSAILALIPCFSPCCLIGLPAGIMAIQALNDPRVREAFDLTARNRYGSPY